MFRFPDSVFAEGFTFLDDSTVCVLTWREHTAYFMNPWTMEIEQELYLNSEGWGICRAGSVLAQSDGTSILRFRDPTDLQVIDSVSVCLNNQPQFYLNELEFRDGLILANQWRSSRILFIDPEDGNVVRFLNLASVVPPTGGVLNGIAAGEDGTLYCTGKNWPVILVMENL